MADASFGVEAAARRFNLEFLPLVTEDYVFVCREALLASEAMKRVIAAMQSREFTSAIKTLPGYRAANPGACSPPQRSSESDTGLLQAVTEKPSAELDWPWYQGFHGVNWTTSWRVIATPSCARVLSRNQTRNVFFQPLDGLGFGGMKVLHIAWADTVLIRLRMSVQFSFQPFNEAIHSGVIRAPGAPEDGNLVWPVDVQIASGS